MSQKKVSFMLRKFKLGVNNFTKNLSKIHKIWVLVQTIESSSIRGLPNKYSIGRILLPWISMYQIYLSKIE